MIKNIKSNWREIVSVVLFVLILLAGLALLGSPAIARSGASSAAVSVAVTLLGGIAKFTVCLAMAWFGLSITFPEANRFVVGTTFDGWWEKLPVTIKAYVALSSVAVLAIVSALCLAS